MNEFEPLEENILFVPLERQAGYNMFLNGELYGQLKPLRPHRKIQNRKFYSTVKPKLSYWDQLPDELTYRLINLYPRKLTCVVAGKDVSLSLKEFKILAYLVNNKDEVVSREDLSTTIWGVLDIANNVIDVHVKNIRKKLMAAGIADPIETKRGSGYCLKPNL